MMKFFGSFWYMIFCLATAMIGKAIHGSTFWAIMDFLFAPFAWLKWLLGHEVNVTIIQKAFEFFLK